MNIDRHSLVLGPFGWHALADDGAVEKALAAIPKFDMDIQIRKHIDKMVEIGISVTVAGAMEVNGMTPDKTVALAISNVLLQTMNDMDGNGKLRNGDIWQSAATVDMDRSCYLC